MITRDGELVQGGKHGRGGGKRVDQVGPLDGVSILQPSGRRDRLRGGPGEDEATKPCWSFEVGWWIRGGRIGLTSGAIDMLAYNGTGLTLFGARPSGDAYGIESEERGLWGDGCCCPDRTGEPCIVVGAVLSEPDPDESRDPERDSDGDPDDVAYAIAAALGLTSPPAC
jgi:hypothetical protein